MNYREMLDKARQNMKPKCRVCPECNGIACRGELPGTGGYGNGRSFTVCREYLKSVKICMDTLCPETDPDLKQTLLGQEWSMPLMIAPIGGMAFNYNGYLTDLQYNSAVLEGALQENIPAFSGDTPNESFFRSLLPLIKSGKGSMISTVKPWPNEYILEKTRMLRDAGAKYFAMDVDSAYLPALKKNGMGGHPKSEEDLRFLIRESGLKLIVKGVMTAQGALTAREAGASAIIVSSHGGRHFEDAPATASVLPEIRSAVGEDFPVFVDGGIRTGADIFKVLALGADAAMIGRPYAIAVHGALAEGVHLYTERLREELRYIMALTGCADLRQIRRDKIRASLP